MQDNERPVLIAPQDLSAEALAGIIENFILREGTDYGVHEVDFEKKFSQVRKKIETSEFLITFDPSSESVTLLTRQQWTDFQKGKQL
jgi:uncharacterized protein